MKPLRISEIRAFVKPNLLDSLLVYIIFLHTEKRNGPAKGISLFNSCQQMQVYIIFLHTEKRNGLAKGRSLYIKCSSRGC